MMKASQLVSLKGHVPMTASLAIASGVSLPHATVLKLIRKHQAAFQQLGFSGFEIQKKRGSQGLPTEFARLNEDQATFLMTLFRNSEIVVAFKLRLVQDFRKAVEHIGNLARQMPEWQDSRKQVAFLQRDMTDKLATIRALQGKTSKKHHFINEALLLTFAMQGKAKPPVVRDNLDAGALELFGKVQELNGSLIVAGLTYEQRKKVCRDFVESSANTTLLEAA